MRTSCLQTLLFMVLFTLQVPLLGRYMFNIFSGKITVAHHLLGWLEKLCYRIADINPQSEMSWIQYGKALLTFNAYGFLLLFCLQLFQGALPLNPEHFPATSWSLAFNTAVSFVTNTNWQSYAGETTLSPFTQMLGLTSQNFLSAATGMATLVALTRGLVRSTTDKIGNFWVDLVRSIVYLLLPLSIILGLFLVREGVVQTIAPYVTVSTLDNGTQTIPLGPVASQVAIKQLGTNGGGFFNANSAHPFENPTPFSNLLEMLAILLIPSASIYTFGMLINSRKHASLIFFVMFVLWCLGVAVSFFSEHAANPAIGIYPVLEGKETRFTEADNILWSVSTTATSNGSVNSMLSSLSSLAGGMSLFNMMIGEVIFGGVGVGLCSLLMFILLTVFLSGLMVGRTPEYLGKKIEKQEMQWVMLAVLMPPSLTLLGAGISCLLPTATSSLSHAGPHGLSEMLYAFSSAANNNGSAFAGLNSNVTYYNLLLGIIMLAGRTAIILPSLAIAGLLAQKKITPPSIGTFSTQSLLFAILLLSVIFIVGALTFFPALSLAPFAEWLLMREGRLF